MRSLLILFVSVWLVVINACTPARYVKPLAPGEHAVTASLGGPLIKFGGAVIPVPLTSVGYGYGLDTGLTFFGNLHTTSLLYGTGQIDAGMCWNIYTHERFQFNGVVSVNAAMDKWERNFRAWPVVDLNASWDNRNGKGFWYAGCNNWIEFSKVRAHNVNQETQWIFSPQFGYTITREKWNFQIESKYILPYKKNKPNVTDYIGISGYGAAGIYFGVYRRF